MGLKVSFNQPHAKIVSSFIFFINSFEIKLGFDNIYFCMPCMFHSQFIV